MAESSVKAAPKPPGVSDGSVSQEFLQACEAVALEVGQTYWPNCAAGATVLGGVVTVEIRAYERAFQVADLSASGQFTADNTTNEMRNYWGYKMGEVNQSFWGFLRLDTDAPHAPPASDVEPP